MWDGGRARPAASEPMSTRYESADEFSLVEEPFIPGGYPLLSASALPHHSSSLNFSTKSTKSKPNESEETQTLDPENENEIDYMTLPPLDGEEGELIDDEACYSSACGWTKMGILDAFDNGTHKLALISACQSSNNHGPDSSWEIFPRQLYLPSQSQTERNVKSGDQHSPSLSGKCQHLTTNTHRLKFTTTRRFISSL